jgi:hypothetical protein
MSGTTKALHEYRADRLVYVWTQADGLDDRGIEALARRLRRQGARVEINVKEER